MATCAELVGNHSARFEAQDSYSILPVLTGAAKAVVGQPAIVNISSTGHFDIRKGPWKLIEKLGSGGMSDPKEVQPKPGEAPGQLYDLDKDPHEDHNLYSSHPEKVKELEELLEKIKEGEKRLITK
jgi:arylsulfatase A-like enzyme